MYLFAYTIMVIYRIWKNLRMLSNSYQNIGGIEVNPLWRATQYGDGSMLCKNPIFFTMKEFPQISDDVIFLKVDIIIF